MQKNDTEFWNGLLKGLLLAEREIRRRIGNGSIEDLPGLKSSLVVLANVRGKIEDVHASDLERALLLAQ